MLISVDPSNGLAIYDQIVRQIKFAIASGVVLPGELVPSVRELAKQVAVNPNTVSRAYRELQSENVLETVRGTGLEVTKSALKKCRSDRVAMIRERLRLVLIEAQQSQLDTDEIRTLAEAELSRLNGTQGEAS
jgi:GntR family transcriptional regulator